MPPLPIAIEEKICLAEETSRARTLISLEQLEQFYTAELAVDRVECLQSALKAQHNSFNPRTSAWVDFCFGVLTFARDEAHLSPEKTLMLLTLAHEVYAFATQPLSNATGSVVSESVNSKPAFTEEKVGLQGNAETGKAICLEYPSMEAVYEQFHEKVRQVSGVLEVDNGKALFSTPLVITEVAQIVAFFTSTLFRHLRAYQYLNRVPCQSVVRECSLPTETPLPPPPLADAILQ